MRRALYCLNPKAEKYIPSPSTIHRDINKMYNDIQDQIRTRLPSPPAQISIALDIWSGNQRQGFLGVKAYWITEQWKFTNATLAFRPLYQQHTGELLHRVIEDIIEHYNISGQILAFTTDNASNNIKMMKHIIDAIDWEVQINRASIIPMDSKQMPLGRHLPYHVPCLAHVIQLSLGELAGQLRIKVTVEEIRREWEKNELKEFIRTIKNDENCLDVDCWLPWTLAKVKHSIVDFIVDVIYLYPFRFEHLPYG